MRAQKVTEDACQQVHAFACMVENCSSMSVYLQVEPRCPGSTVYTGLLGIVIH